MRKIFVFFMVLLPLTFMGCVDEEDFTAGSLEVFTAAKSSNEQGWHSAASIRFYVVTEKAFYEADQQIGWYNAFREGTFNRELRVNDLLPGNYVIGFYEEATERYNYQRFQIIGGKTTSLTLR